MTKKTAAMCKMEILLVDFSHVVSPLKMSMVHYTWNKTLGNKMAQLRQITKYLTRSKYSHCIILRVPWAIKRYKYAILITLKQKMVKIASKEQQVFWFME